MVNINIYITSISCIAIFYIGAHLIIIIDNHVKDENVFKNSISDMTGTLLFASLGIITLSTLASYCLTFFVK